MVLFRRARLELGLERHFAVFYDVDPVGKRVDLENFPACGEPGQLQPHGIEFVQEEVAMQLALRNLEWTFPAVIGAV